MIEIKPVQIGLPPQEATHILVRPIIWSTTDLSCNTYYEVIGQKTTERTQEVERIESVERVEDVITQDGEGNDIVTTTTFIDNNTVFDTVTTTDVSTVVLQTGNHQITEEEYAERGSDNAYIENLVLDYLWLERL